MLAAGGTCMTLWLGTASGEEEHGAMTFPLFDLSGRRALVTGSGRGIGLAIARALHAHGASIVLSDRYGDLLERAKASFGGGQARVSAVPIDVADAAAVEKAVDGIEASQGPIDILVNNAGVILRTPILETPTADVEKLMAVNVLGVYSASRAVARHMVARKRGKIISLASIMSEVGRASTGPYTASKGAVRQLTKAMCAEWAPHGINVNAIGPGFIKTDLTATTQQVPEFNEWIAKRVPMGRWGNPEDLVGAAVFLAAPASDFVNGHILTVDGGTISVL